MSFLRRNPLETPSVNFLWMGHDHVGHNNGGIAHIPIWDSLDSHWERDRWVYTSLIILAIFQYLNTGSVDRGFRLSWYLVKAPGQMPVGEGSGPPSPPPGPVYGRKKTVSKSSFWLSNLNSTGSIYPERVSTRIGFLIFHVFCAFGLKLILDTI